jgi:uncharacterized membrane protein YphA (DoxX/SURF4 family)
LISTDVIDPDIYKRAVHLLARLAVGLLFFLSGRGKLFVAERRQQMRQTLLEAHVPFPDFNTILRLDGGIRLRLVSRNRGSQHLSPA